VQSSVILCPDSTTRREDAITLAATIPQIPEQCRTKAM
jgi:hypothetical protein